MLDQIRALAHLNALGVKGKGVSEFNATLPLLLKVLEKKGEGEYLLRLGNATIATRSQKELTIGQKYWAQMSRSSVGAIVLSNLIHQPQMLETLQNSPLKFSFSDLEKIFKEGDLQDSYKDFLLDKFVNAQTRYEFLSLGNLLLSLQKNVLSFVISDSNQDSLVQLKVSKSKKQSLEFYALYPNLGPIRGRVYLGENGVNAQIYVAYESIRRILEADKDRLKGFDVVQICMEKNIEPLFEFEESLLDIKG